jgi:AcrR family transcriptional regulator
MDDLASEVDIGKGTIYLYFRSKEDLVYSHIDRVVRQLIERLKRVLRSTLSPGDKLREMIVLRVTFRFDAVQGFRKVSAKCSATFAQGCWSGENAISKKKPKFLRRR